MNNIFVTGAGVFVGGHHVNRPLNDEFNVTTADLKDESLWFQVNKNAKNFFSKNLRVKQTSDEVILETFDKT